MAEKSQNIAAKMAEPANEDETELTMCDVLEEEKELEEDAKAVLGDSDDTNCTYNLGYVSRQALYACATCTSDGEPGGICLACSYACHENHDLVELYTKRNFRCDCGNRAFPNNPCRLCPKKEDRNPNNSYNQNFRGVYCNCSRPYPDPADHTPDEMIQCIICEDWYHGRHLGARVPDNEDFGELVCSSCMSLHPFLYCYKFNFDAEKVVSVDVEGSDVKPVVPENRPLSVTSGTLTALNGIKTEYNGIKSEPCSVGSSRGSVENAVDNQSCASGSSTSSRGKDAAEVSEVCRLKSFKPKSAADSKGPAFFPEGWRKELCRCQECYQMYEREGCSYLLDENDTIKAYEERGKCRNGDESQYDKGLSALSKLDRVKQMEAIHEYNNMKVQLKDYLKPFADAKRTVSAKDIHEFFDGMQQRKRQRTSYGIPHFCR